MALIDKASLLMVPSTYEAGTLYNVLPSGNRAPDSTDQNSGYDQTRADFTFDRGSNAAATRVNADGLIEKYRENLILQSNQFDTTWAVNTASVTSGQIGYDGSSDAWLLNKAGANKFLYQTTTFVGVQTISIYAKAGSLNWLYINCGGGVYGGYFDLSNGVTGSNIGTAISTKIEAVGNTGWWRCEVSGIYNGSTSFRVYPADGNNDTSGTSGNIVIQDAQFEQGLVATDYIETGTSAAQSGILEDMPRLDYSASCPSLLLEPQRTNLVTNSEYIGGYINFGSADTANETTSPEGIVNAALIEGDGTQTQIYTATPDIIVPSAGSYTLSIFAKKGTEQYLRLFLDGFTGSSNNGAYFDLDNGTTPTTGASIDDYGNGWYRCYITATIDAGDLTGKLAFNVTPSTSSVFYGSAGAANGKNIYIYGAQLEQGSYPTSYIPTYGTSVTRVVETCLLNNSSALPTSYPFTLYTESIIKSIGSEFLMSFLNASDNVSYASMYVSSGIPTLNARSGSSDVAVASPNSVSEGSVKIVGVFESSTLKLFVNGALKASISNTTTFQSGWNDLLIGQLRTITDTGNRTTNRQALVFPTALTDSECIALTTL